MYLSHFGLNEQPFSIAPDPGFLFLSRRHQEALGHLLYGAGQTGGFVALTGEVGTGKTTLVRTLLEQKLDNVDIALCLNPGLSVNDFVESLCDELGVEYQAGASLRQLSHSLNQALLASHAAGRHSVAIIDEAQNLSREVLEQIRLLTNLETNKEKLLRIILVGQPELQQLLARNDLRQLAQRITARYHLGELNRAETAAYIQHRLSVAGTQNPILTKGALSAAHRLSNGIPRLINILCDRALTMAYADEAEHVTAGRMKKAAHELLPDRRKKIEMLPLIAVLSFLVLVLAVLTRYPGELQGIKQQLFPVAPDALAGDAVMRGTSQQLLVETPAEVPVEIPPANSEQASLNSSPVAPSGKPRSVNPVQKVDAEQPIAPSAPDSRSAAPVVSLDALFEFPNAVESLLERWQVTDPASSSADTLCQDIQKYQLRCLEGHGSLSELRDFNRPALLTISRAGAITTALLQAADEQKLIFQSGAGLLALQEGEFQNYWTGAYRLLLRLPASGVFTIRPEQSNAAVLWLRKQISQYDGLGSESASPYTYDDQLKRRVELFQRKNDLEADGVVGGKTLTLLQNLRPMPGTPLLRTEVN